MSDYNLIPGVDENYQFPPEIRLAFIESLNIRNVGAPMTTAERNALNTADLDPGYYIFNTESQTFQIWRADFEQWHDGLDAPGTVKEWPGSVIPPGWKKQDGASLSRSIYFALYAKIGTTYGGSGTPTHFNLPNRGGRVTLDANGTYPLGAQGGNPSHQLTIAEMPSHNHAGVTTGESNSHDHSGTTGGQSANHYHLPFGDSGFYIIEGSVGNGGFKLIDRYDSGTDSTLPGTQGYRFDSGSSTGWNQGDHSHGFATDYKNYDHTHAVYAQGGGAFHPIMQPYQSAHMIIKY